MLFANRFARILTAHRLAFAVACALGSGCSADTCPACDAPEFRGKVEEPELFEISGIAASFVHDDVIYAHNDSGDRSRFFAMTSEGKRRAMFEVDGAANIDWEDIARAPCDLADCLYVADIGDNEAVRGAYAIYVVPEPATIASATLTSERIDFTYPGGEALNAEVMLVHPKNAVVTIVTKAETGAASIFELDEIVPGAMLEARKVGELEPPEGSSRFTGGSIHPDATGILLRTETRLFHYPMDPDETAAEALRGEPCQLELAKEAQGEAVTWLRGGTGIMTVAESDHADVNVSRCG